MPREKKELVDITNQLEIKNILYQDEQKDNLKFTKTDMRFCTFERLGIKKAEFSEMRITQSIFDDVYARTATFKDVDFTGTIFRNCNFDKAKFNTCKLWYCKFYNTSLPVDEIVKCLPPEANLRKDIAQNLKMNYLSLGQKDNADIFLDIEINAGQEELYEIFKAKNEYYKKKYDTLDRIGAFFKYSFSLFSGFLWGYGHKVRKLLLSYSIMVLILSFCLFQCDAKFQVESIKTYQTTEPQASASNQDSILKPELLASMEIILCESVGYSTKNTPINIQAKSIVLITRFLGIIYLGLLGATLYRKIAR